MKLWHCLLLLIVFIGMGCNSTSPRTTIEGVTYGVQLYHDLPVPQDFTFDDSDNSWAYPLFQDSALGLRSCILKYEGDRDVGQLANWYISQMPVHNWVKTSDTKKEAGRRMILTYTKENEEAVIEITRLYAARRMEPYTIITITLGAIAKG